MVLSNCFLSVAELLSELYDLYLSLLTLVRSRLTYLHLWQEVA
jgi:hypothetical protein